MEKWEGERFKSLPVDRQEAVREQVARGAVEAKDRHERGMARRAALKDGREYLASTKLPVVEMCLNGYSVLGVVDWNKDGSGKVAYSICSPKDSYSSKIGRGLVGIRLKEGGSKFRSPAGEYQKVGGAKVEILRAILNSCKVPPKMFKHMG